VVLPLADAAKKLSGCCAKRRFITLSTQGQSKSVTEALYIRVLKVQFNIIVTFTPRSSQVPFPFWFVCQIPVFSFIFPHSAACGPG
jgi:hypothetical protein